MDTLPIVLMLLGASVASVIVVSFSFPIRAVSAN
jgi:hypothetical protein